MTVESKKHKTKTLIALVSQEIDRVGEVRKKYKFYAPASFCHLIIYDFSAIVTLRSEKIIRKPRDVFINPNVLRGAHIEALHSRKTLGE